MKSKKNIISAIIFLGFVAVIILGITAGSSDGKSSTEKEALTNLASCLADSGAKFYGAYWCPHCMEQKRMFGVAATKELPYVECGVPGSRTEQTEICKTEKVEKYPTWKFADGTVHQGGMTPKQLAEKTSCEYVDTAATEASTDTGTSEVN
jgi:transcription elongation factor Elf1